jgi:hypothetical protein
MTPEPPEEKKPFGERAFYVVLWLLVAAFLVGPVVLWLAGEGSTLGAFIFWPILLLVLIRFRPQPPTPRNDRPSRGEEGKPT